MSAKYAFIAGEEGNYPIYKMCVWAKVSRAQCRVVKPVAVG